MSYYSSSYYPLAQAYYDIGSRTRSWSEDRFTSALSEATLAAKTTRATSAEPSMSKGYSSRERESSSVFSSYDLLRNYKSPYYYSKTTPDTYSYSPSTYSRNSYTPSYTSSYRSSYTPSYTSPYTSSYSSYYTPRRSFYDYDYSSPVYSRYYSRYSSPYSSSYSDSRSAATYLSAYNPYYSGYIPLSVRYPYSSGRILA